MRAPLAAPGALARIVDSARLRQAALWGLLLLALSIPIVVTSRYGQVLATRAGIYVLVVIGLNVVSGYGGQISIGHGALVAVGGYAAALAIVDAGLNFWIAAPIAIAVTTLFGCLMALPALRMSTWYFALVTLGFAEVVGGLLVEMSWLTHGFSGVVGIPMPRVGDWLWGAREFLWFVIGLNVVVFIAYRNLVDSRFGRALVSVRVDPAPATAAGVSVVRVKVMAFALSAALAGLGGALFAVQKTVLTPDDFTAEFSIFFLLVMVLGGEGRLWGPLLGTLALLTLPTVMESLSQWRVLVYGVVLLILILFAPFGLDGAISGAWTRLRVSLGLAPRKAPDLRLGAGRAAAGPSLDRVEGAALEVQDVLKTFGGVTALDGVRLSIPAGSTHALVGPNGSGKTTLVNVISGFYPPDGGTVRIAEVTASGRSAPAVARFGVGRTFQTPRLLPDLSVLENVMLGAYTRERAGLFELAFRLPRARRERQEIMDDAKGTLEFVGLGDRLFEPATELPHGQQRLVEVARALLGRPRLLLLDEPAAGLSLSELDRLAQLIRAIRQLGTTVLIVEHHIDLVADICDQVTVLDQGKVLAQGTPSQVFAHEAVARAYMGKAGSAAPASVAATEVVGAAARSIERGPVAGNAGGASTQAILEVTALDAGYGPVRILEGITLSVQRGTVVALVGANGAGKTTLLRTLSGLIRPTAGHIRFDGQELAGARPDRIVAAGLLHVAEARRLFRSQSVAENLDLGLYGMKLPRSEQSARIAEVLDMFPVLASRMGLPAGALSGGQQQMLAIAQVLVRRPAMLLLDEPSLGLAPVIVDQVFEVLERLNRQGTTILLVEQMVERALAIAHRAYVMQNGRIVGAGTAAELAAGDVIHRAYLGTAAPA